MSKAITEKGPDDAPGSRPWTPNVELAPSVVREDEPMVARIVGMAGAVLVIFASVVLLIAAYKGPGRLGAGWMTFVLCGGVLGMLFHAAFDGDLQVRRLYWGLGLLAIAVGAVLCIIPVSGQQGGLFPVGFPLMGLGLIFQLVFLKHESDEKIRALTQLGLLGVGGILALTGLIGGHALPSVAAPQGVDFLLPYGTLLALLGLAYLTAFVVNEGTANDLGYFVGLGIGAAGALTIFVVAARTLPVLFFKLGWMKSLPTSYLVPGGLVMLVVGALFVIVSLGLVSDNKTVVLARRELAAFFFSPIAHIVLFGLALIGWVLFLRFVIILSDPAGRPLFEPVVENFFLDFPPIICVIFTVPVLTMRLFSEEQRSGTMEVLLTAPVEESSVVLGKFLACLAMFLFLWVPWGLYFVGLRLIGGKAFDYHPLFVFLLTLLITGAGFISMGLFFSSLTRNQIAAAVLTFAAMLALTTIFFFTGLIRQQTPDSVWIKVLEHMSYVDLWIESFRGYWVPRKMLFWVSATIFWLFATVKVLESRKWR